jgi:hypothetical protein
MMKDIVKSASALKNVEVLDKVSDIMPKADVLDFMGKLSDAYRENAITVREIARINAARDVLMTEITQKYNLYHKIFDRLFDQRQEVINKYFYYIERGIADNNRELITGGMQGLSQVVSSSPFANIKELSGLIETGKHIEI